MTDQVCELPSAVSAINVGVSLFADALADQGSRRSGSTGGFPPAATPS